MKIGEKCGETPIQKHYDVIIVGGGGHGLGTAYYLAKHVGQKYCGHRKRLVG